MSSPVVLADARVKPATDLDRRLTPVLAVAGQYSRATNLANAAVRETYEESELMITRTGSSGNVQQGTWQFFQQLGQAPDLASLKYVGRAITPASLPIRFHARFFSCNADLLAGGALNSVSSNIESKTKKVLGDGELQNVHWIDVDKVESLPMRDITRFMLNEHISLTKQPLDDQIGDVVYLHRGGKLKVVRQNA